MSDTQVITLNCNNCDGELNLLNCSRDNKLTTVTCEYCNSINLITDVKLNKGINSSDKLHERFGDLGYTNYLRSDCDIVERRVRKLGYTW